MEQNPEAATKIETLVRQKLNEGTEVTANTVKPLAAAAREGGETRWCVQRFLGGNGGVEVSDKLYSCWFATIETSL